jgi:hypothetical protein
MECCGIWENGSKWVDGESGNVKREKVPSVLCYMHFILPEMNGGLGEVIKGNESLGRQGFARLTRLVSGMNGNECKDRLS